MHATALDPYQSNMHVHTHPGSSLPAAAHALQPALSTNHRLLLALLSQKWEHATPAAITEVFAEVLGQGDPVTAADMHIMQLASTLQHSAAPSTSAGPSQASPLRSPTPLSSNNHAAAVAAVMAAAGSSGLLGVAGGEVQQGAVNPAAAGMGPSGPWMDQAGAGVAVGVGPMSVGPGGAMVSPFQGGSAAVAVGSGAFAGGVAAGEQRHAGLVQCFGQLRSCSYGVQQYWHVLLIAEVAFVPCVQDVYPLSHWDMIIIHAMATRHALTLRRACRP